MKKKFITFIIISLFWALLIIIAMVNRKEPEDYSLHFPKFWHETPLRYSHWAGMTEWQHKAAHYRDSCAYAQDTLVFMDSVKKLILKDTLNFKQ